MTISSLKPGYKSTEIGIIPEDWEVYALGDIGSFKNGINKNAEAFGHGNPFINLMDVFGVSSIDSSKEFELVETSSFEQSTYNLKKGDVLFVRSSVKPSGVGLTAVIEEDFKNTVYSGFLIRFRPNISINTQFLKYCFYESSFRNRVINASSVSANTNINQDNLKQILIPIPPLKEQEKIAEVLTDIDRLIESLEEAIAKKTLIKKGTMQLLLTGKKRLTGFGDNKGYQQTELGLIPEDWEVKKLGDIADPNLSYSFTGGPFGSNLKSSDYTSDGIRVIQLQNIGDGYFLNDYEIFTSNKKADELLSCNIYPGDIILSKMGDPVARACIIPNFYNRYLMCSDGIRLAVDKKRFNTYFIYTMINSSIFRNKVENASTGSTRKRIGLTELRNLKIFYPPLSEQEAIAEILTDMDNEIIGLEEKLNKTRQIKQGMMQELLTGKTRLIEN